MKIVNALLLLLLVSCSSKKQDDPSIKYFPQVKSIIQTNYVSCHSLSGSGSPKGLPTLLETDDEIVAAASNIKAATIDPVSLFNKRMPYGGELSESDKNIILKWSQAGALASNYKPQHLRLFKSLFLQLFCCELNDIHVQFYER
jgi:hypothetical protein